MATGRHRTLDASGDPLVVRAAELLRRPGTDKHLTLVVSLDALGIDDDPRFEPGAEVTIDLRLESLTDGIVVDGELRAPWVGTCRRCLMPAAGVAVSDVHELYQRMLTDPDAFELDGDLLDLRPVVRELVLLDAPVTPLCRPDCAGLCPQCGANWNDTTCACAPLPVDDRWSALDALRVEVDVDPDER